MLDRHYILLLILLLPALVAGQTIHFEKDKVIYRGKIAYKGSNADGYHRAKEMLLSIVEVFPDSLRENKNERELSGSATMRLPSAKYHEIRKLDYKVRLRSGENYIGYEIGDIKLTVRERGKKGKTLRAEEMLKAIEENGAVAMKAEKQLNEIDMRLQKLIASMQSQLTNTETLRNKGKP